MKKVIMLLLIFLNIILSSQASNTIDLCPLYDFPEPIKYAFYERQSYDGGKTYFSERKCIIEVRTKEIDAEKYLSIQYKTWDYKINGVVRDFGTLSSKLTIKKLLLEKDILWRLDKNQKPMEIANYDKLIEELRSLSSAARNSDIPESEKQWLRDDIIQKGFVVEWVKFTSLFFNTAFFRKYKLGKNDSFETDSKLIAEDVNMISEQNKYKLCFKTGFRISNDKLKTDFEIILDSKNNKILNAKSTVYHLQKDNETNPLINMGDRVYQLEIMVE